VYGENTLCIITRTVGSTTEKNAPIATYENFHLKNAGIKGNLAAIINIFAGRRVRLKNILVESPNWELAEGATDRRRVIEIASKGYPVRDVLLEDVRYTGSVTDMTAGTSVPFGVIINGNVQCTMNNVVIDAEVENYGVQFVNEAEGTKVVINDFECDNKQVTVVNAEGKVSADIKHIKMANTHRAIGTTAERPAMFPCETGMYYDTDLSKMLYWNGTAWDEM